MAVLRLPTSLKAAQLKHTAFLMGLPAAGTKSELESVILTRLNAPPLLAKPTRIVSVDMGIKNLGICALETTSPIRSTTQSDNQKSKLKILDWKKLDVMDRLRQQPQTPVTPEASNQQVSTKARRQKRAPPSSALGSAAFAPSSLSKIALSLTKNILDSYRPTHILIERQRFRSGGAAAVQEWTLRVNMLESMIWACLEALRTSGGAGDDVGQGVSVHEVNPARVAKFWCLEPSDILTGVPSTLFEEGWKGETEGAGKEGKISKGQKITVVQSWLWQNREGKGAGAVELDFADEAMAAANLLVYKDGKGKGPKQAAGKLDDLADCLLQGAAWVRWEENRQRILELVS